MDFGKMIESYLEKDANTSWVIDSLEQKSEGEYMFDTLQIFRFFRIILDKPDGADSNCFNVSLYVKRDCDNLDAVWDSKLTLSKMKKLYSGEIFDQKDFVNDEFLTFIVNNLTSLNRELKEQDVIFDEAIMFKAQALIDWSKRGKTKPYYIVGVQLEKLR